MSDAPAGWLELAQDANQKLQKSGADSAEQSFGLGCLLLAVPTVAVIAIFGLLGKLNLIMVLVALAMTGLAILGLTAFVASMAYRRGQNRAYQDQIGPGLALDLQRQGIDPAEFDRFIHQELPAGAPLLALRPRPVDRTPPNDAASEE